MKNKLILSDADGVLVNWQWAFSVWMQERGYTLADDTSSYYLHHHYPDLEEKDTKQIVKQFNESAAIGFLPALRDATHYVRRLHEEHGYQFRVITSLSLDKNAQRLRDMNLRKLFGNAIETIICLDTGANKDVALEDYRGSGLVFVEDKYSNFEVGLNLGLKSILVTHDYNKHEDFKNRHRANNWKEIYEIITAGE